MQTCGLFLTIIKMTPNKRNINNDWKMCQSKSYPGKYYYFNVATGEVTWNFKLNDPEKKIGQSLTIADPCHSYPEPRAPPMSKQISEIVNPTSLYQGEMLRNLDFLNLPSQVYGQSMIPNYFPNYGPYMPNLMWSMPMPIPMLMPNAPQPKYKSDQTTQTHLKDMSVKQTCTSPLSQRFTSTHSNLNNMSTPKSNCDNDVWSIKIIDDKNIQSLKHRKRSTSDTVDCDILKGDLIKKRKTVEGESLNKNEKHRDITQRNYVPVAQIIRNVKYLTISETETKCGSHKASNGINTDVPMNSTNETTPPKKEVKCSFNETNIENHTNSNKVKSQISIADMKESGDFNKRQDRWYIVTDADVLLQGFDFLQEFIENGNRMMNGDKSCYIYIPYSVQWDIKSMCIGDSQGQERVTLARQVTRKLVTPLMHVVLQPETQTNIKTIDKIFECCMELLNQSYHVVLLTDNPVLLEKAVSHLRCYSFNKIKNSASESPGVTFKFRRTNEKDDKFDLTKIKLPSIIEKDLNDNIEQSNTKFGIETGTVQKSRVKVINIKNVSAAEKVFFQTDISGQFFKGDLRNSVEEYVKRYEVIDEVTLQRITQYIDEWICRYIQIMEEAIYHEIKNDSKITPLNLLEYVQSILDHTNVKIKTVAEKLYNILSPWFGKDTIRMDINPKDFMQIIGCSILLLKTFKASPHNGSLLKGLEKLLCHIGDPSFNRDFIVTKPAVVKTEIGEEKKLANKKTQMDTTEYLTEHFSMCPSVGGIDCTDDQPSKVIRTLGKELSSLTLNLKKSINFDITDHGHTIDDGEKRDRVKLIRNIKIIDEYEKRLRQKCSIDAAGNSVELDCSGFNKTENKIGEDDNEDSVEPKEQKIIRKLKILDEFEKKYKKMFQEANFLNDISEISSISPIGENILKNKTVINQSDGGKSFDKSDENCDNSAKDNKLTLDSRFTKNDGQTKDEGSAKLKDTSAKNSDSDITNNSDTDAPTNDSGFESLQAYSMLKNFLTELSGIFIVMYNFVEFGIEECRKKNSKEKLIGFEDKVNMVHIYVGNIIRSLKSIINRESKSCSKLSILVKNARQANGDRKITKYKQIITKCKEQAEILDSCLRYLLCIIRGDYMCRIDSKHTKYINVFE